MLGVLPALVRASGLNLNRGGNNYLGEKLWEILDGLSTLL